MTDVRAAYDRAIAAYNAGDVDGFADAHGENAVLITPAGTVRGRAAIRDYRRRQRTAFPDLTLAVEVTAAGRDLIARRSPGVVPVDFVLEKPIVASAQRSHPECGDRCPNGCVTTRPTGRTQLSRSG